MKNILSITDLHVTVDGQSILSGLTLNIESGAIHALMGPNGSGKSSLAYTLMGHPSYQITGGKIRLCGDDITELSPDKRAQKGLFLAFQQPQAIPGVTVNTFLKEAYQACTGTTIEVPAFNELLQKNMTLLGIDHSFAYRSLHEGFSGGEKKRLEMLQLLLLRPKVAILDEIDSGLDIDGLKLVAQSLAAVQQENPTMSILLITHYQRMLTYTMPSIVHIMHGGTLVASGDMELVKDLEHVGYEGYVNRITNGEQQSNALV